ncbi:hypothetical protein, partial [Rhizobium leguminosarum]|uniref:hypothetical protein n=1 Tax=Rhizobium leguminosarum TaxID=384 RepID=UPI003F9715C0
LELYAESASEKNPMIYYCMSYFSAKAGNNDAAKQFAQIAHECNSDYCFPNKLEEINVLQYAIDANPSDDKALYYLGN